MKNTKTSKPTTLRKTPAKKPYRLSNEFLNMHSMKIQPVSNDWLDILAEQLVEWATTENPLILTMFYDERGIHSDVLARWMKKSKKLKQAHEFSKRVIGGRRELGALNKTLDSAIVARTMAMYNKDWQKLEEWRSELRKTTEEQKGDTIIRVEMPSYLEKKDADNKN